MLQAVLSWTFEEPQKDFAFKHGFDSLQCI